MDKVMKEVTIYIVILLFIVLITLFGFASKVITLQNENDALKEKLIFLKELVLKGANRDSLYREHMGKTLYIDNNSVEVGYDGYLKLKKTGPIKKK